MKKKQQTQQPQLNHEWVTVKEFMAIIRRTSWNGVMTFAKRHKLKASKGRDGGKILFSKQEIQAAILRDAVQMGA